MDEIEIRARRLAKIRKQIKELRYEERDEEEQLAALMEHEKSRVITGVGSFERKWSSGNRTWESDELLHAIMVKLPEMPRMVNPQTGEVEGDAELMKRLLADAARFEWRSTVLKKMGFDVSEFSTTTEGRYSVKSILNEVPA